MRCTKTRSNLRAVIASERLGKQSLLDDIAFLRKTLDARDATIRRNEETLQEAQDAYKASDKANVDLGADNKALQATLDEARDDCNRVRWELRALALAGVYATIATEAQGAYDNAVEFCRLRQAGQALRQPATAAAAASEASANIGSGSAAATSLRSILWPKHKAVTVAAGTAAYEQSFQKRTKKSLWTRSTKRVSWPAQAVVTDVQEVSCWAERVPSTPIKFPNGIPRDALQKDKKPEPEDKDYSEHRRPLPPLALFPISGLVPMQPYKYKYPRTPKNSSK